MKVCVVQSGKGFRASSLKYWWKTVPGTHGAKLTISQGKKKGKANKIKVNALFGNSANIELPLKTGPWCMCRCVYVFSFESNKPWGRQKKQQHANIKYTLSDIRFPEACCANVCVCVAVPSNEDAQQINMIRPCQQHSHTKSQFEHK